MHTIPFLACLICLTGIPAWSDEGNDNANQERKPNVLFIAIDDLNDWTDTLKGNPQARTPYMDKLAARGMLFTNAHCAAPACGPSRSAIMSGIRPSTSGNYINRNSFTRNPILNNSVLLPEFFQQNGYYVAGAGKLFHGGHFQREVKGRGFDEYYPSRTQDLPSFAGLKFNSRPPLAGWAKRVDWGPLRADVTVDDHPDGITANWATKKLRDEELQEGKVLTLGAGHAGQPYLGSPGSDKGGHRYRQAGQSAGHLSDPCLLDRTRTTAGTVGGQRSVRFDEESECRVG